jgi:hypothetical protein
MLTGIPLDAEGQNRVFSITRWNRYISNWPIVLDALRQLWETGKVSEFKTPFYEPLKTPTNQ